MCVLVCKIAHPVSCSRWCKNGQIDLPRHITPFYLLFSEPPLRLAHCRFLPLCLPSAHIFIIFFFFQVCVLHTSFISMEVREEFFPAFFFLLQYRCWLLQPCFRERSCKTFIFFSNEAFVVRFTEAGNRHSLAFLCAALKHSPFRSIQEAQGCIVVVPLPGKVVL